jgi:hypothetical protein
VTTDRNCLDAETVAAWMDGGLDAASVAAAEAHASTCERCQALLATVVKTLPADPLPQPSAVSGFSRIDTHQTSLWRWWFAPLAATAAAVTIWMVVPQDRMQPSMETSIPPPAASAPARDADAPAKPQAESGFSPVPPSAPPAAAPRDSLADSRRNVPAAPANEAKAKLAAGADTGKFDEAGRKDQAARGQSGELLRDKQGKREENSARAAEMRQAVAEPAAAAAERAREAPAPSAPSVGAITQLRKQVLPEIVSPDPLSRWRATAPGTVERSEDGGRTWRPVRVAANEEVLGGASPGRLVAWMVGRSGLVLLSTDGTNFTRLPFPAAVDLVAVTASDARTATVTTADGRTFRTEDAGRNWRQ